MAEPFIADFHIHSHYSVATSKDLDPEHLDLWARIKGLTVVGTGDFTHPGWLEELRTKLEPAEPGLYRLRPDHQIREDVPQAGLDEPVRFILSAEISTIYKKADKTRKVHHVILAPDFETVEKIQRRLSKIGNITSDGRPILGLDSRNLLEIAIEANPEVLFIPAHIWTPWFSALGDKSGFDSIDECYGDLADRIYAVETGLSSDPAMNWRCRFLDRFTILSNSDAHSPEKLGREANLFSTEISYPAIIEAIKTGDPNHFGGTIEFFPQEGKYHHDGHRRCNVSWHPDETARHDGICPVCGKKVTVGVMSRVIQLGDREDISERPNRHLYYSLIPLREVLSEIAGSGPDSKKVTQQYMDLIGKCRSELNVLLHLPLDRIQQAGGPIVAEAIRRMREGKVHIQEGYDGEYGVIKVFSDQERRQLSRQSLLFNDLFGQGKRPGHDAPNKERPERPRSKTADGPKPAGAPAPQESGLGPLADLNPQQMQAACHLDGPAIIIAGPGTGKTKVLTCRISHLIEHRRVAPEAILAVTFTNKAADEMRGRLREMLSPCAAKTVTVCTFHALGYAILREQLGTDWVIIDQEDRDRVLQECGCDKRQARQAGDAITAAKQQLLMPQQIQDEELGPLYLSYQDRLCDQGLLDLDDLVFRSARLLMENPRIAAAYRDRYRWVLVDEYQDVNLGQYQMIRLLCPDPHADLCVIGDPNQAIYGFRGADVRFIRQFSQDYPDAQVYRLTTSYRCSDVILRTSSQVVYAQEGASPSMLQGLPSGVKLQMVQHPTDKAEAEFVARTIERMIGGLRFFSMDSMVADGEGHESTQSLADFAILCRTTAQMPAIEKALHDHSIPFQRVGQEPFFRQEPVRSVIDCLKLATSPDNRFLQAKLAGQGIAATTRIDPATPAKDAVTKVIYAAFHKDKDLPEIKELIDLAASSGCSAQDFVRSADLAGPIDTYKTQVEQVSLMSLHASKGLEFVCVFVVGCEDGLLPYRLFEDRKADGEEERRLLYVGMTRAKHWLYLTWAKSRILYGKTFRLDRSPFLDAIERELVDHSKADFKSRRKKEDNQPTLF